MIYLKTDIEKMPDRCDECQWHRMLPDHRNGWKEECGYTHQFMDDDTPEEWHYDWKTRPKACPLVEIPERSKEYKGHKNG